MSEIQRGRMLAAMAEVACELGAAKVTVAHVVARSGVSRRTFYEIFEDRDDCFLASVEEAIARACEYVVPAFQASGRWQDRIRTALLGFLCFLDEEPAMGRVLVVESLAGNAKVLERRQRVLADAVAAVEEGRKEGSTKNGPPPLAAEGVVGAVFSVIHGRMLQPRRERFQSLLNPLMSMVVLPFLGTAASKRELERPAPDPLRPAGVAARPDLLAALQMRLTYRTMRVLGVIAAQPESSNREIAQAAEIADPGQMSKLLARLHQLGLVENASRSGARGEPNAWRLTRKGREVEQVIAGSGGGKP